MLLLTSLRWYYTFKSQVITFIKSITNFFFSEWREFFFCSLFILILLLIISLLWSLSTIMSILINQLAHLSSFSSSSPLISSHLLFASSFYSPHFSSSLLGFPFLLVISPLEVSALLLFLFISSRLISSLVGSSFSSSSFLLFSR